MSASSTITVRIPDDSLALACGADAVASAFAAAGCTVERVSSWGMHWLEPLVEIDGHGFGPATPEDVAEILAGTSARAIGRIEDHPFLAGQTRLTFARAGKTRPLSLEDYAASGGWEGLTRARALSGEAVVAEVTASGLRGRGGAGFPAGIKWDTVRKAQGPRKYIVCNADEGDSGTFADRMLIEGDPFQLIEGMAIAAHAVGAGRGYVYLRSEYPHAIARLEAAIALAAPIVAPFVVEVRVGAGAYVCGEETSLLNSLEGKRGEVRAKPPLPALEGLFGCPTVVNNVLTLGAAAHILREGGAAHYASLGTGRSRGTMPIQLAGNLRHGGLFEAPFGMTRHFPPCGDQAARRKAELLSCRPGLVELRLHGVRPFAATISKTIGCQRHQRPGNRRPRSRRPCPDCCSGAPTRRPWRSSRRATRTSWSGGAGAVKLRRGCGRVRVAGGPSTRPLANESTRC